MKNLSFIISLLLISTFSLGQDAKSILDKVSSNYQNKNTYYIKFKSELNNEKANTKDQYSGEIYVKNNQYNLSVPSMNIKQIFNGNKLYTINSEMEEVTVTKPDEGSNELFTPTRIFNIYKNGFNLTIDGKEKISNKNITRIKLTPTTKRNLKFIIVGVNESSNNLIYLQEVDINDTITTLTVEKQLINIIIPKSLLNFDKKFYKDYYISEI